MKSWPRPPIPTLTTSGPGKPRMYDTSRRAVVEVGPDSGTARLYVCGITPYDATHLGHAATYVTFDLLNRTFRDSGVGVLYAQNITDVDDPLLERASATGVDWAELAEDQIALFRTDMEALRVIPPDHYIGAVECIPCVVSLIESLKATGAIYQVEDSEHPDWYFEVHRAPGFLGVSALEEAAALAIFAERGGDPERPGKRHPLDCLVWQMARPDEPAWDSSLGHGRPGWHIECTAIALRYLGPAFDVQGGGSDLVFPHHEMCAAEGLLAAGEQFAQAYVHCGMVGLDGEKMSKSKGNLVLVSKLRAAGVDPMAIRLALLNHHYRRDWEWFDHDLAKAEARLTAWRAAFAADSGAPSAPVFGSVRAALRNDLNAPAALAAVDAWVARSAVDDSERHSPFEVGRLVDALLGVL